MDVNYGTPKFLEITVSPIQELEKKPISKIERKLLVGKFSRKVSLFNKSFQLAFQEMFISLSMRFSSLNLGDNAFSTPYPLSICKTKWETVN